MSEEYEPDIYGDEAPNYDDEFEDEEDLEEGEVNLFSSMPWINQNIGSMMEHQLTRYKDKDQCRWCGKKDKSLESKDVSERFCSEKCSEEWHSLMETRIAQGRRDLRVRGYD